MMLIKVPCSLIKQIKDLLAAGDKIPAIKLIRDQGRDNSAAAIAAAVAAGNSYPSSYIGLKEAKEAAEWMEWDMNLIDAMGNRKGRENGVARVTSRLPIKKIVLDTSGGDVEVDLEEMNMMFMMQSQTIKLEELASLLDLYNRIKGWVDGQ